MIDAFLWLDRQIERVQIAVERFYGNDLEGYFKGPRAVGIALYRVEGWRSDALFWLLDRDRRMAERKYAKLRERVNMRED